jgi:cell division septum initiation protein DivIVA
MNLSDNLNIASIFLNDAMNAIDQAEIEAATKDKQIKELTELLKEATERVSQLSKEVIALQKHVAYDYALEEKHQELKEAIQEYSDYAVAFGKKQADRIAELEKKLADSSWNNEYYRTMYER